VTPRLDAVEEVTLTTAAAGADASGQGAIQVRFVTRSGTNKFETSLYDFMQHAAFNSNTFFGRLAGLPVPQATNQTYGGRVGGPIILPGFDGRGKAFFFFNHEEVYNPTQVLRTGRTIIRESALNGDFTYGPQGSFTTKNVLAIAQASGITGVNGTTDPTVINLLKSIRAGATTDADGTVTELVTSPNTANYDHLVFSDRSASHADDEHHGEPELEEPPAGVVLLPEVHHDAGHAEHRGTDVPRHDGVWRSDVVPHDRVDLAAVDGLDGHRQRSARRLAVFAGELLRQHHAGAVRQPGRLRDQHAVRVDAGLADGLRQRAGNLEDAELHDLRSVQLAEGIAQLPVRRGLHRCQRTRTDDRNVVPFMSIAFQTNFDPAAAIFNDANFPGSTQAEKNSAAALYALLTGPVSSITATGRLNNEGTEYIYNGVAYAALKQDDYSFYAQDTWRWKPTVTFTLGARYQFTLPMTSQVGRFTTISTSDSCGPVGLRHGTECGWRDGPVLQHVQPGQLQQPRADAAVYNLYSNASKGYSTDLNNIGPVLGVAWRPNVQNGS
jgi:hypothetical protein